MPPRQLAAQRTAGVWVTTRCARIARHSGGAVSGPAHMQRRGSAVIERTAEVDYRAFLNALPTACMLLDDELVVTEASAAFLSLTGRTREQVVGQPMLASFPDRAGPAGRRPRAAALSRSSARRALATGAPDEIDTDPLRHRADAGQRTLRGALVARAQHARAGRRGPALRRPQLGGGRHAPACRPASASAVSSSARTSCSPAPSAWSPTSTPAPASAPPWPPPSSQAGRRLQGLAFVALELAAADSVEELTDLVVVRGVAAMGCDGGGVAVRDDDEQVVRLTITDTWREGQRLRQEMPYSTHLPSVVAAIVPEPIFLGTRAEGLAWGPEMDLVYTTSGRDGVGVAAAGRRGRAPGLAHGQLGRGAHVHRRREGAARGVRGPVRAGAAAHPRASGRARGDGVVAPAVGVVAAQPAHRAGAAGRHAGGHPVPARGPRGLRRRRLVRRLPGARWRHAARGGRRRRPRPAGDGGHGPGARRAPRGGAQPRRLTGPGAHRARPRDARPARRRPGDGGVGARAHRRRGLRR